MNSIHNKTHVNALYSVWFVYDLRKQKHVENLTIQLEQTQGNQTQNLSALTGWG